MKSSTDIALKYSTIALAASALNLILQALIVHFYSGPFSIEISIMMATALVLPIKYYLDKRIIFDFKSNNLVHDIKHFRQYVFVSIFTVFVFWGTEAIFQAVFDSNTMRYIGGAIGLAISFYMKYQLDKRFVFFNFSEI
jgi:putative flippase GtrA